MVDNKKKKDNKNKKDKIFTPGNIILGIIIIVLVVSLFFDFFKQGDDTKITEKTGCPYQDPNILISNIVFSENGVPISDDRLIKPDADTIADYRLKALIRNLGTETVVFTKVGLTGQDLGDLTLVDIDPIEIEANSMATLDVKIDSGGYHKIDLYTSRGPCEGYTLFHEFGAGSKYAWDLEEEQNMNETGTA